MNLAEVLTLLLSLRADVMGVPVTFTCAPDRRGPLNGRLFVQCVYATRCSVTGEWREWRGRKWYLSEFMTEDEVVKTCYAAFRAAVEHEVMEGFTFDGARVFNPHTPFRVLMEAAKTQQFRKPA